MLIFVRTCWEQDHTNALIIGIILFCSLMVYLLARTFKIFAPQVFLRPHDTKVVLRKIHSRLSCRGIDLVLILTPLRIVNAVNPLLSLNHQAPEFGHI